MAVEWTVVTGGSAPYVAVRFGGQGDGHWQRFKASACGVAAVDHGVGHPLTADAPRYQRILSLPEAYYALAEDELLRLREEDCDLQHVWSEFSTLSVEFAPHSAVYHHYRRLGYLAKPGLNYGAHYVLYRGSVTQFHSDYVVYIVTERASVTWQALQALTRVVSDVKKTLLLCEVAWSSDPPQDELEASSLTQGTYYFHGRYCSLKAVEMRSWDVAVADNSFTDNTGAFAFQPQSVSLQTQANAHKLESKKNKKPKTSINAK